ncbi:MAG TPA: UDP-3-O-(3-hydroxymyristoyl)glucosamine N-acyltransferase [Bryobacteraceae bacterium]|jgi:UDP-3-O-[3-hydroxymyristoyl] glucosamine N-acyltransferase|nr:UDP-3-O-(3-hydroxymyristoyl)glucosamine N-acyltransferase [Bryobacteraceae bacterium]
MRVRELAGRIESNWEGDGDREISGAAGLEEARETDLSFITQRTLKQAGESRAGCLLVPADFPNQDRRTVIRVLDPREAMARAIAILHPAGAPPRGIHPSAVIGENCEIAGDAFIGPLVTIGRGARIGARVAIHAGTSIGDEVEIGEGSIIYPNVTIYGQARIGREVILHSGCVIGADGFGFVLTGREYRKFPQIGWVEIGDRVEIGANSCVDRAALGVTSIGEGTKLDNMVHVAHNCKIGRHVVIAAQTGFSGGVEVGDYAVIGGQVGVGDKAKIEAGAVVGSGSGVLTSKIVHAGEVMWGTPARPLREYLRQLAALSRLAKKGKTPGTA